MYYYSKKSEYFLLNRILIIFESILPSLATLSGADKSLKKKNEHTDNDFMGDIVIQNNKYFKYI